MNKTKNIVVFGGGIAGMTVADELSRCGFTVCVYEKNSILGGMARSERVNGGVPAEHSWRGYAPFYHNLFDILKRIPANNGSTVYDNLTEPIEFLLVHDTDIGINISPTLCDNIIVGYYILKVLCSNNRREVYDKEVFKKIVVDSLSRGGVDDYISMLGPGLGLDQDRTSIIPISKYVEFEKRSSWSVMNGPTNEVWFDHWESHLTERGVKIYKNKSIEKIVRSNNKITSCILEDGEIIEADEYVFCINPYELPGIGPSLPLPVVQISFRFGFDKEMQFPKWNNVISFPDSEFNITLYAQEHFWSPNISIPYKALWSGTACRCTGVKGRLYSKYAVDLTNAEFLEECWDQISRSLEFRSITKPTLYHPVYSEVWDPEPKWGNVVGTYGNRIDQKTNISNMHIGGAFTNTTVDIYSMEGAAESGKIISKNILAKNNMDGIFLYKHKGVEFFRCMGEIDDALYEYKLPNVVDVIMVLLLVCLVHLLPDVIKNKDLFHHLSNQDNDQDDVYE